MASDAQSSLSKAMIVAGWVVSVLPSLALLMSGSMKLIGSEELSKSFEHLGFPDKLALILGLVEIGATLIYLIPWTSALGAIVLTGYLGGAVAAHARLEEMNFIAPVILGILIWLGLVLRDPKVRAILPLRRA